MEGMHTTILLVVLARPTALAGNGAALGDPYILSSLNDIVISRKTLAREKLPPPPFGYYVSAAPLAPGNRDRSATPLLAEQTPSYRARVGLYKLPGNGTVQCHSPAF